MSNNINDLIRKVVDTEMNGIVEKINERIGELKKIIETTHGEICVTATARANELFAIKKIIMFSQKEPCYSQYDCEYEVIGSCTIEGPCPHQAKPLTKGGKIRESNESLKKYIMDSVSQCETCIYNHNESGCRNNGCEQGVLDYLNQLQEGE